MNAHLMIREAHPKVAHENVFAMEYMPEEMEEIFNVHERILLDAGEVVTRIDHRTGWTSTYVRMDVLARNALGTGRKLNK